MEILINGCPLNIELNDDWTLHDVISFVADWSYQRDLIFTEAAVNNKSYAIDTLPNFSIPEVKTLNCFLQSKSDVVIDSLHIGVDYCTRIQKFFKESIAAGKVNVDEIKHIVGGINWIIEVITKISEMLGVDIYEIKYKDNSIAFYFEKLNGFKKDITDNNNSDWLVDYFKKNDEIFSAISGVLKMLLMSENMKTLVIQSIDSPDVLLKSIKNIKGEVPAQIKNLEEIAISYQTKRDDEASKKLENFIDFIFDYGRTCYQIAPVFNIDLESIIVNDVPLSKRNIELQGFLFNVINAMENNDIISLSDVLEYEIKSLLENLGGYIDILIDNIEKKS
ncbi:MAG: hypothetical protein V1874_09970 [Spirochaetota bacterium]